MQLQSKRMNYFQSSDSYDQNKVQVKLIKEKGMIITGAITGRSYIFRFKNEVVMFDKADSMYLSKSDGLLIMN